MKVKRNDNKPMYLFMVQDGCNRTELGLMSLIEACRTAHKAAKSYLNEDVRRRETEIKVFARTILYDQPREITTISAWRSGLKVNIIHA